MKASSTISWRRSSVTPAPLVATQLYEPSSSLVTRLISYTALSGRSGLISPRLLKIQSLLIREVCRCLRRIGHTRSCWVQVCVSSRRRSGWGLLQRGTVCTTIIAVALMVPIVFSTTHWYCPASFLVTSLKLKPHAQIHLDLPFQPWYF